MPGSGATIGVPHVPAETKERVPKSGEAPQLLFEEPRGTTGET